MIPGTFLLGSLFRNHIFARMNPFKQSISWSEPHSPRREFLKKATMAFFSSLLGTEIVFADKIPQGYVPLGALDALNTDPLKSKHPDLVVLSDKPWNVETPIHLLDDAVTPAEKFFIRNNGKIPDKIDASKWTLTVEGESVKQIKLYTLQELKTRFKPYTYQLVTECGGNGRSEFSPAASGNQWGQGAVACAQWTGLRLKDLLDDIGLKNNAVYVGYYGIDEHLSGDTKKATISRGVPIWKAREDESLLAYQMNGKDIPLVHGYPLRMVIGGWPASVSGKWVNRLVVRDRVHDGEKMNGTDYRVPCNPVAPGETVKDEQMCIIESMPVKSMITYPRTGAMIKSGQTLPLRGHAWAGDQAVSTVQYSIDYGATWQACSIQKPVNRLAWQHFQATVSFPKKGYYEIWIKATDARGISQPMVVPAWNPKGYLNNACHRIAIKVS
jgi:DMSO/TMAO reductase YedYZ molybdopterin-dependent catalytic subunit